MRKFLTYVVIIISAGFVGAYLGRSPWDTVKSQEKDTEVAQQKMRAAEKDREKYMGLEARYKSGAGKEEQARLRNWVKPGELLSPNPP
jgi:hypothetical protein